MLSNHVLVLILFVPCVSKGIHFPLRMSVIVLLAAVFLMLVYRHWLVGYHQVYLYGRISVPIVVCPYEELALEEKRIFLR